MTKKIKKNTIDESFFGDLERSASDIKKAWSKQQSGGLGTALKAFFSPERARTGVSMQDQAAKNTYVKNFVARSLQSINAAIDNELVDMGSDTTSATTSATSTAPAAAASTTPTAPTAPTLGETSYQELNALFETYMRMMDEQRKNKKPRGQRKAERRRRGTTTAAGAAGQQSTGQTAGQTDSTPDASGNTQQQQTSGQLPSIGAWYKENFLKPYLQGINYKSAEAKIDQILKNFPTSIKNKTIKTDLAKLANIAWALGFTANPQKYRR